MLDLVDVVDLRLMKRTIANCQTELRILNASGLARHTIMYAELVDCHAGVFIPKEFCDSIGDDRCRDPYEEGYWDEADAVYEEYCEALKQINADTFRELGMDDSYFFIESLECDGSLALFLYDPEFSDVDEDRF